MRRESTTIDVGSTTTEASREGIQSSQTLPSSNRNASGAHSCPFFIACLFWRVWNTTRNVWNIRETPDELMHGASVVWHLAWNKFAAAV